MKRWFIALGITLSGWNVLGATDAPNVADGLMIGAPPPAAEQVTRENWDGPPYNVWAYHNIETLLATTTVDRGTGPISVLESAPLDLSTFEFTDFSGKKRTLVQFLRDNHVDALLLYSDGKVRLEIYRNGNTERTRHIMRSVTKSFTGLVAEMLIGLGTLDETKRIIDYVPELNVPGGAYADATLRNLLNMEIGIDYTEVYDDPSSTVYQFYYAAGYRPPPSGVKAYASLYEFLPVLNKKGEHGQDFHYVTANSEVLGWVVEKATGKGFARVFEEMVYSKVGAERDAFYVTDARGKAVSGSGLNITARDALRLGVMMSQNGRFNDKQIVPAAVVAKIAAGTTPRPSLWGNETGSRHHSYMSQWYIDDAHGVMSAVGVHGQTIHIQSKSGVVMVVQSSYPEADGTFFDIIDDFFYAVAGKLSSKP